MDECGLESISQRLPKRMNLRRTGQNESAPGRAQVKARTQRRAIFPGPDVGAGPRLKSRSELSGSQSEMPFAGQIEGSSDRRWSGSARSSVGHPTITAAAFCLIKSMVRATNEVGEGATGFREGRDTQTDRDIEHLSAGKSANLGNLGTNPLRDLGRLRGGTVGQQRYEFFPSVTCKKIGRADVCGCDQGDALQYLVSRLMASDVVHPFEVVDVEQDQ